MSDDLAASEQQSHKPAPGSRINQMLAAESEVSRQVLDAFEEDSTLALAILARLADGLLLQPTAMFDSWEHTTHALAARVLDSLLCAYNLIHRGYPSRAMPLVRAAEEDLLTWAYIRKFPQNVHFWQRTEHGSPYPKQKKPPNTPKLPPGVPTFEKIREELGTDDPTVGALSYSILSTVAHPRSTGLTWQYVEMDDGVAIGMGPRFEPRLTLLAFTAQIPTSSSALSYLARTLLDLEPSWSLEAIVFLRDTVPNLAASRRARWDALRPSVPED